MRVVRALVRTSSEPAPLATTPMLLVTGTNDDLAMTMPQLAEYAHHAEITWVPGQNHLNAVTARAFKRAAIDFLAKPTSKCDEQRMRRAAAIPVPARFSGAPPDIQDQ